MKYYISIIAFMIMATSAFAQEPMPEKRDDKRKERKDRKDSRMEAKKIGYITEELNLSTEEAQKFWPIYNEFHDKMKTLRNESREGAMKENFTDSEGEAFINEVFEREQEVLDYKIQYYNKMKSAISKAKVAQLFIIEKKFRDNVYKSIKRKMKDKRLRKPKK